MSAGEALTIVKEFTVSEYEQMLELVKSICCPCVKTGVSKLTKGEAKLTFLSVVGTAGMFARLTKSPKDDAVVELLLYLVSEKFDELWALWQPVV